MKQFIFTCYITIAALFACAQDAGLRIDKNHHALHKEDTPGEQPNDRPVVLFKEGEKVRLMGLRSQSIVMKNCRFSTIMFFLFLSEKTDSSLGTFGAKLISDTAAEIHMILQNHKEFILPQILHSINRSDDLPMIFMLTLNDVMNELLKLMPVEKLSFKTSDFNKEYILTDEFAEAFKSLVN